MRIATLSSGITGTDVVKSTDNVAAPSESLFFEEIEDIKENRLENRLAGPTGPLKAVQRTSSRLSHGLVVGLAVLGMAACQPGATSSSTADSATNTAKDAVANASGAASDAASQAIDSATDGASSMFDSDEKKASYAMGFGVTRQVTGQFSEAIDHDAFVAGVRAQLEGKDSEVSQEDAQRALTALNEAQQAKQALAATGTAKEGAKFLADNAGKEGVVTTASGLQYLVLTQGTGPKPKATDTVKTHYEGTLINGEVFDSSVERGQPAEFPLNRVISGWTEALQLMNTGSKYRLFIPPELAYGNQATGSIPPQSTLIFEVELLEILGGDAS